MIPKVPKSVPRLRQFLSESFILRKFGRKILSQWKYLYFEISGTTRTKAQKTALLKLLRRLKKAHPEAHILGHRDLPNVHKNCPCFDAQSEYSSL